MRIPHELREEFAADASLIERLTRTNYEFRRLSESYDEVNNHIFRIESDDERTADETIERLKKRRLLLKDDIAAMLARLKARM